MTETVRPIGEVRTDWTLDEVRALHALPFSDLIHRAEKSGLQPPGM